MTAVLARPEAAASFTPAPASKVAWLRERGMGATVLVAAISSAFGVLLIVATGYIAALAAADPYIGESGTLALVLGIVSFILVGLAVYVASIVTANTFAAVIAGRTRQIALMRLIGASARSQRSEVAGQGFVVGVIGALVGLVVGVALAAVGIEVFGAMLNVGDVPYSLADPVLVLPVLVVAFTTWIAAWAGSRAVLSVTPLQALSGSVPLTHSDVARQRGRNVLSASMFVLGALLLAAGVLMGLIWPEGILVAFLGGILSFTGLATGAAVFMPPVLRLIGRAFGKSATATLAAQNALRHPARSSRMAIGVVMGVTLVTMFAVALETMQTLLAESVDGELAPEIATMLETVSTIVMALVGVSAVIAAVGMVNLLTIGVVQRRRELGLLRALGLSNTQVRQMVLLEAAHIAIAALLTGLVLGIVYGWAGVQSVFGSVSLDMDAPAGPTMVWPALPAGPLLVVIFSTVVLTLVATVVPTRLATRVAPVEALAAD